MLETAVELRQAFDRLAEEEDTKYKNDVLRIEFENEPDEPIGNQGKVGPPTDDDWEKVVAFVKFLRVVFDVTLNVQAGYFTRVLERMLNYDAFTVKVRTKRLKELIVTLTNLYASMNGVQNSSTKKTDGDETWRKKAKMMEDRNKDLENVDVVVDAHEVDRYLLGPFEKPELDQEEREHGEKLDKQKEMELIEKKNKAVKASKGFDAGTFSKKKI
ncbi:zinc finger (ubiquitin-hydrolase)domain-containing protein [Striga asiatica]|uniref:Zinc finger (Ubiquitin-hydrolase)domain-containing protein n=1 Tax=Striga asiatica TaxID=4170 RepID=A0A5A7Q960_STRAF|nr:zinc finger (ubiquitin-hydrolase)domain-containing protein [Striga asiatica]